MTLGLTGAVLAGLARLYRVPFGFTLRAAQDAEARARADALPVDSTRILAFAIAGGTAGLAGALFVLLDGEAILGLAPEAVAKRGVGRTFQTSAAYRSLSVLDNLRLIATAAASPWRRLTRPLSAWPRAEALGSELIKVRSRRGGVPR